GIQLASNATSKKQSNNRERRWVGRSHAEEQTLRQASNPERSDDAKRHAGRQSEALRDHKPEDITIVSPSARLIPTTCVRCATNSCTVKIQESDLFRKCPCCSQENPRWGFPANSRV